MQHFRRDASRNIARLEAKTLPARVGPPLSAIRLPRARSASRHVWAPGESSPAPSFSRARTSRIIRATKIRPSVLRGEVDMAIDLEPLDPDVLDRRVGALPWVIPRPSVAVPDFVPHHGLTPPAKLFHD